MTRSTEDTVGQGVSPSRPSPGYRLITWLASKAPHPVLVRMATVAGWIHYWTAREKRRHYLSNTSQAIDFKAEAKPWHAFQSHALNILELLKATSEPSSRVVSRLSLHGAEHIDAALRLGKGLILTTMHLGNWELSGLLLSLSGYPITTVAGTQLTKGWSDQIKAFKERYGIRMVSSEHSMRSLYRDLQSNRIVVLHIDGDVYSTGVEIEFLGRTVTVPRGPARLSRAVGAPTAFAYCRRTADCRLQVHIESPQPPPHSDEDEHRVTEHHVRRLEKCVLEDPGQWCIFRKL
jgi:KDO2-lipid IV(A) lauroyltransferase